MSDEKIASVRPIFRTINIELESGTWAGDFVTEFVALIDKYQPGPLTKSDREHLLESLTTVFLARTSL